MGQGGLQVVDDQRLADLYAASAGASGPELDRITRLEYARWGAIIAKLGLKAE